MVLLHQLEVSCRFVESAAASAAVLAAATVAAAVRSHVGGMAAARNIRDSSQTLHMSVSARKHLRLDNPVISRQVLFERNSRERRL
jgi:hypothetical protein